MSDSFLDTDVLIVGGGPAGASTALSLLNHSAHRVALVEHSDFNTLRVGEHVSSSIFGLIHYLGIEESEFDQGSFIPVYANTSYWGSGHANTTNAIFTTENSTFQLDRDKLDYKLIEVAAERGAIVFPRTKCIQFEQLEDKSWEVLVKHPAKGKFIIKAKYLVDATGRKGSISRQIGLTSKKYDSLMGVGAFLGHHRKTAHFEHFLETSELGWWYAAFIPNNRVVLTFFTDADIVSQQKLHQAERWNDLIQQTNHIKQLVKGTKPLLEKPWIRDAHSQLTDPSSIERFIAVGDAAVSFDPISSMGIGFSISSACHAARHIRQELFQEDSRTSTTFQRDIEKNYANYLQLRQRVYSQERRWLLSPFWQRRMGDN